MDLIAELFLVVIVDTDNKQQTTPGVWHKLPPGEIKRCELDVTIKASILGVGCSISQVWNIVGRQSLVYNCS